MPKRLASAAGQAVVSVHEAERLVWSQASSEQLLVTATAASAAIVAQEDVRHVGDDGRFLRFSTFSGSYSFVATTALDL